MSKFNLRYFGSMATIGLLLGTLASCSKETPSVIKLDTEKKATATTEPETEPERRRIFGSLTPASIF